MPAPVRPGLGSSHHTSRLDVLRRDAPRRRARFARVLRQRYAWEAAGRIGRSKRGMPSSKEQRRKRYAEDAEYRKIVLGYYRRYRAAHRAEINERKRHRWATDPAFRAKILAAEVKTRRVRVLKRYGISEEEYERLLRLQNGVCAICKEKPEGWLCVDHCHLTGKVRGLLCKNCNSAL